MNELAIFAGAGGGILGGKLLGWRTVCAVEREPYAASVLVQRQNDGLLPAFPVWDDVCTFDGRPWNGVVDVVSGGFPCQDISAAGKGAGIDGERSGLWGQMARIVGEVRPRYVFVENSPLLVGRGLVRVLADLAEMGFDARWGIVGACDVGAPHRRERCWIVAHASGERAGGFSGETGADRGRNTGRYESALRQAYGTHGADRSGAAGTDAGNVADTDGLIGGSRTGRQDRKEVGDDGEAMADAKRQRGGEEKFRSEIDGTESDRPASWFGGPGWWITEPDVGRVAYGVAARVDRLKAIGNGQVPQCAAEAWRILTHNVRGNRLAP